MFSRLFRLLRRLRRSAGLGLAALATTMGVAFLYSVENKNGTRDTPLNKSESIFRNLLTQVGWKSPVRKDIVFLGYDEASMNLEGLWPDEIEASPALKAIASTQGAWPWPRSVQAALLDRLAGAGAKVVVFDIVFQGPAKDDETFRAALERWRDRVVLGANLIRRENATYAPGAGGLQLTLPSSTLLPESRMPDNRVGLVNYQPGVDGLIRAVTFTNTHGDLARDPTVPVFRSLVAQTLHQAGYGDLIPRVGVGQALPFRYGGVNDRPWYRLLRDLRRGTYQPATGYMARPVYEVLVDTFWNNNFHGGEDIKGKFVLIGPTATVLHDFHETPLGQLPGPALHVHALSAVLNRDFLRFTDDTENLLLIAAAGLLAWLVGWWVRPPVPRTLLLLGLGGAYLALVFWLYNHAGLQLLAVAPLLSLYTGGFGGVLGEYVIERAEKARVRGVLDRLVSKDIVRELLSDRERYASLMRGQRRSVTVLFSDVRGFTTLSEAAADPAMFIAQLNEYLGEMVDIVFRHRGTLDKFIGDAVMAVWGSMHTEGVEADARAGVAAAVEMRERLASLNAKWEAAGKLRFDFGIGLNYGEVIVGGLGSEKSKMEITVMGDAVNLASRMEGLTKDYGLDLLIGESVARLVSDAFRLRTVDLVRVKGKKKPAEVMAVLGPLSDVPSEAQEYLLADYEDAILLYRRQDFAAAARLLEGCLQTDPNDRLAGLYLERCRALLAEAPGADWDGVRQMTTK